MPEPEWLTLAAYITGQTLQPKSNGATFRLSWEVSAESVSDIVRVFKKGNTGAILEWRNEEEAARGGDWHRLSDSCIFAPGNLSPDEDGFIHARMKFTLPAEDVVRAIGPIAASIWAKQPKGQIRIASTQETLFDEDAESAGDDG